MEGRRPVLSSVRPEGPGGPCPGDGRGGGHLLDDPLAALVSDDRRSTVAALRLAGGDEDGREQTFERIRDELETPPAGLRVGLTETSRSMPS